ncbi:MAG: hypothetical protein ABI672_18515 [Vicinamibacteria bacterium]
MNIRFRSVAIVFASAGYAHAAMTVSGDDKAAQILVGNVPASAWVRPALTTAVRPNPARPTPVLAGLLPTLPSSFFGTTDGSHLLFLSPLSPLRAALRVATRDLAAQTLAVIQPPVIAAGIETADDNIDVAGPNETVAARRREVVLRQRRKSVLNERGSGSERTETAQSLQPNLDLDGFSGRVELLTLPAGVPTRDASDNVMPNGAGLVRVSGYLTDDLTFAVTGLAAESAATTWRAGAEFDLALGDRQRIEAGAVYGTRFNATNAPLGGEIDHRSVGAFRVVHALQLTKTLSTRAGGRFIDAPYLKSGRSIDPEFSVMVEEPDRPQGRAYVRFDLAGDTLFPGLEVVAGESDLIALSEGLPVFARNFEAQRTWSRAGAIGFRRADSKFEGKLQDQTVTHALLVFPSSISGAPLVQNGNRSRVQIGSLMFERTFAHGQAQAGIEYGYGRFAEDPPNPLRARDFHQITTRFDAYLRRSGTGIAIFHRVHEGADVTSYDGENRSRTHAARYLVEFRQDVPFVPAMIGADMTLLFSLRNVYYDDVERRNVDEFAVAAPPRRITGGIRVKF